MERITEAYRLRYASYIASTFHISKEAAKEEAAHQLNPPTSSWLNVLLVVVPVAIASYLFKAPPIVVFTTNVIAVIPLSSLLTYATEALSKESGDTIGALMNITFGNLAEIVLLAGLYHDQFEVVQASILGSILVNLLFILGTAILAGSYYNHGQGHDSEEAQGLACLLSVSVFSLLIPDEDQGHEMGEDDNRRADSLEMGSVSESDDEIGDHVCNETLLSLDNKDDASIGRFASICLLVVSSLLVAVCAEFLVSTLDETISSGPLSQTFIGLIILPIAGNCAELLTAITVAARGNFDLAIGVSVGSSVQISLFVTPLVVLAGWVMGKEMTLYFGVFEIVALFATTFLVNCLILNSRTNALEGSILCACYFIMAVGAFLFPTPENFAQPIGGEAS
ncbi:hypothetical protein DV738_g4760, partial [Chaetothyriales sp. CBS 135597]